MQCTPILNTQAQTTRYKTARCVLHRNGHFLLAVHSSFWRKTPRRWGLPGGGVEWGEQPEAAVRRELKEELNLHVGTLTPIGRFDYKRAAHMVYAADTDVHEFDWDETELVELRWFSMAEVEQLAADELLHAGYELDAVRAAGTIVR